jgi:hypothetical protein
LAQIPDLLIQRLQRDGPLTFGHLWPRILSVFHLTLAELRVLLWDLHLRAFIDIRNLAPRERSVRDHHLIALPLER